LTPLERSPEATRARLIRAAERLFAAHGIDGVSLREINRAAGARNAIALQYHFEDRAGVLRAILARHRQDVESRRHAMLDQYEADARPDLRALSAALVRPLAAKLADPDGGPEYLQIHAELFNRPRLAVTPTAPSTASTESIDRWRAFVEDLIDPAASRLHRRFTAIRFGALELGRRAVTAPHADDQLFISHLIDLVAGILSAPVSEETLRAADARDASAEAASVRRIS